MRLDIKENTTSNNYELIFSELPPKKLQKVLRELGFVKSIFGGNIYTVAKFAVYDSFIKSLKKMINSGKSWEAVTDYPVFAPTEDSINKKLFTTVTIYYNEDDIVKEQDYIVFELYHKTISGLIREFGKLTYGNKFEDSQISHKKLKRLARSLLASNHVIDRKSVTSLKTGDLGEENLRESIQVAPQPASRQEAQVKQSAKTEMKPIVAKEDTIEPAHSFIKAQLAILISMMEQDELGVYEILSTIIDEMVKDLKEAEQLDTDDLIKKSLIKSINKYKASLKDLAPFERGYVRGIISELLLLLDDTNELLELEKGALSIKRSIWVKDKLIDNVLVPIKADEPFASGAVIEDQASEIWKAFPELHTITKDTLDKASALELFYLAQLRHPPAFGIPITIYDVEHQWKKRGLAEIEKLGFPTDLKYPYVYLEYGYFNITALENFIGIKAKADQLNYVLLHARPLTDLETALAQIDLVIQKLEPILKEFREITSKKIDKASTIAKIYYRVGTEFEFLKKSRQTVFDYLTKNVESSKETLPFTQIVVSDDDVQYEILHGRILADIEKLQLEIIRQKERAKKSFLENKLADAIEEFKNDGRIAESPYGSILNKLIVELKKMQLLSSDEVRKIALKKLINSFTSWLKDMQKNERDFLLGVLNYFSLLLEDTTLTIEREKATPAIKQIIYANDLVIKNVLVPTKAVQPFTSGAFKDTDVEFEINFFHKHLLKIQKENLNQVCALDLFYLVQLENPQFFGIALEAETIAQEWERRGASGFDALGFPTDLKYPYINLKEGYLEIQPLEHFLLHSKEKNNNQSWWYAIRHARPIADVGQMIQNMDAFLNFTSKKKQECLETDFKISKNKQAELDCYRMLLTIKNIEYSKQVILDYLDSTEESDPKEVEASQITITKELHHELQEVINELISIEDNLNGEQETIIASTIHDFEDVLEILDENKLLEKLASSIESFKDWACDLSPDIRNQSAKLINRLIKYTGGMSIAVTNQESSLVIAKDIKQYNGIVENVLVPIHAKEPFESGKVSADHIEDLKKNFPHLYDIKTDELHNASALELFQLSQLPHPRHYQMQVYRNDLLKEWEKRGEEAFKQLGFPTDMNYPYVNIHAGYRSVTTLASALENSFEPEKSRLKWWAVVEHGRPIANLAKGIVIIDKLISDLVTQQQKYINPRTKRPKTKPAYKQAYRDISFKLSRLKLSKQVITNYLNAQTDTHEKKEQENNQKALPSTKEDYIDRVIATMHLAYRDATRLSKKKIENLLEQTGAPSLGELWEAVELSWLLWYKMIYNESISFEARLSKMVHFWNKIQPTYAYSDSSKELYKQYSTPCPIGAIIAQYTGMDTADSIFEPSAGNGLLLVGANPKITHVNEIDKSRKKSLEFQQFQKITMNNGAESFPSEMEKAFDVVVTNPPFAKWEENKIDKEHIIKKYFNNTRGLVQHLRLEHIMSGLALRTMKDNGKCAIIIMGHLYFDHEGFIAKYRPFFNWLYHFYKVDVVLNMNSFKLYNKQGAVARTMLILIGGRKAVGSGVAPTAYTAPHLDTVIDTFEDLWLAVKQYIKPDIHTIIKQLQIAKRE
ncbi:N-6 DNA methylase [Kordia algicida OT-1]|uniref:Putative methylase/helicase n=1 Tax=Kordia algicida OT-1 TaxID=391587 RepID=A9E983_9FLAO|nr:N-6 DNA methylase [Kordia algicida]EDP94648.1 putative methylase/helicase [Kordia algicida OT-1]